MRRLSSHNALHRTFFHISREHDLDQRIIAPRIPEFRDDDGGEDDSTPRICVSPSIDGCIKSIWNKMAYGVEYYVYRACLTTDSIIAKPSNREVPDATMTAEHWILSPISFEKLGILNAHQEFDLSSLPEKGFNIRFEVNVVVPDQIISIECSG